ncbi:MAG: MBL fold metallo-hydrolase, partial [Clostridiales bacterium]|nr:MBL fold metallo-hydrolase [Clostridiales bacterium]
MTDHFDFGDTQIYRLVETGDAGDIIRRIVPAMTAAAIRPYAARFPACADGDRHVLAPVQSFLLFADGRRILIDTGIGNGKPLCGDWGGLDTDWLDRLAAVAPPETIDTVICTHLHADHVGWNTRRQNGVWTPTFPRAAYCLPAGDLADLRARLPELSPDDVCVLRDSIEPVLAAGTAVPVPDGARAITDTVSLVPTPGHTPHHLAVRLTAGGRTLLFCGDLFYHRSF